MKHATWVIASANRGKLAELRSLLEPRGITLRSQAEFAHASAPETGLTFVENALIKARAIARLSGLPTLADDSGLVVPALDGAPGLQSAIYASSNGEAGRCDQANNRKLLHDMQDKQDADRHAFFICVLVLLRSPEDPAPLICEGRWPGQILKQARGAGGFGYDPLFLPDDSEGLSAAELDSATKNRLSHRARALQQLLERLSHAQ